MKDLEIEQRAVNYAHRRELVIGDRLGFGVQGIVYRTKNKAGGAMALKVHSRFDAYCRERDVYIRLADNGVVRIRGSAIPQLENFDDELLALEMTIVDRPFVLDFGGAFLDIPPSFSEETMAEWENEKRQQFGRRWSDAVPILKDLERFGIFVVDVNPNNISWE